ncbi:MAG: ABC transporter permease [Acidimicrobiales bacterium]
MLGYLVRRVLQALLVVIGVTIVVFIMAHLLPGGPARAILGTRATPAQVAAFNQANGYNKPLPVQYIVWVNHLLHGNLGYSYKLNQTVTSLLIQRLPKTVLLVGLSYVVALIFAIPLGIFQARRRNSARDYVLTGASFVFYSMPTFWLGILLIIAFAVALPILPAEAPTAATVVGVLAQPLGLVLPVATLALVTIAQFSRYMRSSTMENLAEDYVRTAWAKGSSGRRVLFVHVLRNALIPIATLIGLSLPIIFSGALVTETVFNYPGMGLLFFQAATTQDYSTLLGVIMVVGVATVAGSLLADLLYAVLDPRVRYA